MALPMPVLSDGDIIEGEGMSYGSASRIWNTWSQDPVKAAVLQAILSCLSAQDYYSNFRWAVSIGLGQNMVCPVHYSLLKGEKVHYQYFFRIPRKLILSSISWSDILAPGRTTLSNINVQ